MCQARNLAIRASTFYDHLVALSLLRGGSKNENIDGNQSLQATALFDFLWSGCAVTWICPEENEGRERDVQAFDGGSFERRGRRR